MHGMKLAYIMCRTQLIY